MLTIKPRMRTKVSVSSIAAIGAIKANEIVVAEGDVKVARAATKSTNVTYSRARVRGKTSLSHKIDVRANRVEITIMALLSIGIDSIDAIADGVFTIEIRVSLI